MPALRSMLEVATTRATSSSGAEPASGSREAGMDVFEIGREIQDLRGRIERMEPTFTERASGRTRIRLGARHGRVRPTSSGATRLFTATTTSARSQMHCSGFRSV